MAISNLDKNKYYTVIEATHPWKVFDLKELVRYKDMFYFMVVNGYKAKQKQTVLGYFWVVFNAAASILFFSIVFGGVAKVDTGDIPYVVFNTAAVVGWIFLSESMNQAVNSLKGYSHLIQKVYFPRIYIPAIPSIINLPNLILNLLLALVLLAYFGYLPSLKIFMIFPILVISVMFSFAVGLIMTTFILQYRDMINLWNYFMKFYLYMVPLAYPISAVPQEYRFLYMLNPAAALVEGFRAALLNTPMPWLPLFIAFVMSLVLLYIGIVIFRSREPSIVDAL